LFSRMDVSGKFRIGVVCHDLNIFKISIVFKDTFETFDLMEETSA